MIQHFCPSCTWRINKVLQNQANAQKQVVKQTALNHEETQKQLEGVATKTTKKIKSLMDTYNLVQHQVLPDDLVTKANLKELFAAAFQKQGVRLEGLIGITRATQGGLPTCTATPTMATTQGPRSWLHEVEGEDSVLRGVPVGFGLPKSRFDAAMRLWETGCPVDPCDASAGFIRPFKQLKPWDWAGIPKTATYSASHEFSHWCLVFARCTELLVPPETSLLHKLFECDDLCQFARELWNIHQQANNKNTSPSPPPKKRYRTKPMVRLMQT